MNSSVHIALWKILSILSIYSISKEYFKGYWSNLTKLLNNSKWLLNFKKNGLPLWMGLPPWNFLRIYQREVGVKMTVNFTSEAQQSLILMSKNITEGLDQTPSTNFLPFASAPKHPMERHAQRLNTNRVVQPGCLHLNFPPCSSSRPG